MAAASQAASMGRYEVEGGWMLLWTVLRALQQVERVSQRISELGGGSDAQVFDYLTLTNGDQRRMSPRKS